MKNTEIISDHGSLELSNSSYINWIISRRKKIVIFLIFFTIIFLGVLFFRYLHGVEREIVIDFLFWTLCSFLALMIIAGYFVSMIWPNTTIDYVQVILDCRNVVVQSYDDWVPLSEIQLKKLAKINAEFRRKNEPFRWILTENGEVGRGGKTVDHLGLNDKYCLLKQEVYLSVVK